jgi:inosine-uridine nucleoside N-ribohydrolase
MPIPCILDCDPGHDDAIAIVVAAASPALELRAITTVAGNGTLERVTHNARRVCTLAGIREVPIAAGAEGPLRGTLEVAADVHGETALDGAALPEPDVPLDPRTAVDLMAEVLRAADEPVAIVAVGPLTNVATLLDRHPELTASIAEIVVMGGSTGRGNRTPYAEFNVWADPEAAAAVLAAGLPLTLVGLNLTHQALATPAVIERMATLGTDLGRTLAELLSFFAATYRELWGLPAPPVHDPCAVAALADRATVRSVEAFVAVETEGAWTRGATVVDLHHRLGHPPNARVALDLDVDRFWDLVVRAVGAHRSPAR